MDQREICIFCRMYTEIATCIGLSKFAANKEEKKYLLILLL